MTLEMLNKAIQNATQKLNRQKEAIKTTEAELAAFTKLQADLLKVK